MEICWQGQKSMKPYVDERLAKDVVRWLVKRAGFDSILCNVIEDTDEDEVDEVKGNKQFVLYCIKAHERCFNGTIPPPVAWNPIFYDKSYSTHGFSRKYIYLDNGSQTPWMKCLKEMCGRESDVMCNDAVVVRKGTSLEQVLIGYDLQRDVVREDEKDENL